MRVCMCVSVENNNIVRILRCMMTRRLRGKEKQVAYLFLHMVQQRRWPEVLLGVLIGAGVATWAGRQLHRRRRPSRDAQGSYDDAMGVGPQTTNTTGGEFLLAEQLVRTEQFFGHEGLEHIQEAFVVIVGLGGVGSHCALSLARSGVGHLKLIDFDQVSLSSLNRHACARRGDVGTSKVDCLRKEILMIRPDAQVESVNELFEASTAECHLSSAMGRLPDFVIDCIDNVPTKVALIEFCYRLGIPAISSGGAGGKADPTKIRIDDISDTTEDDLCRVIRQRLKKLGIERGPKFCYSTERYAKQLAPLHAFQESSVDDYRPFDGFRVRVVPVIAPLPAMFGQAMSSYVLCELAKQPIASLVGATQEAEAFAKLTRKNYRQLYESVKQFAIRHDIPKSQIALLELSYGTTRDLYSVKFRGSSAISGKHLGPRGLQLVPWRNLGGLVESFAVHGNLVCLTQLEAKQHLQIFTSTSLTLSEIWDPAIVDRVSSLVQQ